MCWSWCFDFFSHPPIYFSTGSTQQETISKLQAFGIPVSVIPQSPADNEYHINVMQRRKRLELRRRLRKQRQADDGSKASVQSSDQEQVYGSETVKAINDGKLQEKMDREDENRANVDIISSYVWWISKKDKARHWVHNIRLWS